MKKNHLMVWLIMPAIFITLLLACNNSGKKKPKPEEEVLTATGCNCETDWFPHSQTPAPPEGAGSPFDVSSTTNCIFHQWAWQKFLWLTKPLASGNALFEDSMILVDNQMVPISPVSGVKLVLTDIGQAGSGGVLQSNPAFGSAGTSDTVYYSIYMNSTLQQAADSFKNQILANPSLLNNKFIFPVGSLELKVSWINITALPANLVSNYYTTEAVMGATGEKVTVALLGMHVVGVVINHPEFIWATFEHSDMAPFYDWKNTTTQDVPVTSSTDKLFFAKGDTATWEDLQWPPVTAGAQNVFSVYPNGVPRIANDSPMLTSQKGEYAANLDNIKALNACVFPNLNGDVWQNYFYNGGIWLNMDGLSATQQADTITALGKTIGNVSPGSVVRGSTAVYNITLETFTQVDTTMSAMNVTQLTNCFSCHSSVAKITLGNKAYPGSNSPLYLSHIFRSYLSVSSGVPVNKIELERIHDFVDMLKTKQLMKQQQK